MEGSRAIRRDKDELLGTKSEPRVVDIIVPVFNEEANVDEFYAQVERLGYADCLVFIDNASTDRTLAKLEQLPKGRILRHATNEGYGSSVKDGIAVTQSDLIIIIDADLEYPPAVIPPLVDELRRHPVVYCSRFLGRRPDMSAVRRLGNAFVSGLFNLLFRQHTTDLCTGVKAFRRDAIPLSKLELDGFDAAMEIAVMFSLAGKKIHDVPIDYVPRSRDRSKMRHVPEALRFIRYIVGNWFRCVVLGRPQHGEP